MRYTIATIHPKSGRLSLFCSEYIQVMGYCLGEKRKVFNNVGQ